MSISSLLQVLLRHRRVVGAVAALCALLLVAVVVVSPPTYRASAAVVLLNPPAVPVATVQSPAVPPQYQNPYVQFGDLSVVVDILVRVTASQEVVNALKAKGLNGTFEIAANRDFYRGPIVDVAAEASSPEGAIKDTKLLIAEIQDQLLSLQKKQGTDPRYFIKTGTVVGADRATTVFSGTLRLLIAVGGLGAILTVGSGLLADVLTRRRADRRGQPQEAVATYEPDPAPTMTATVATASPAKRSPFELPLYEGSPLDRPSQAEGRSEASYPERPRREQEAPGGPRGSEDPLDVTYMPMPPRPRRVPKSRERTPMASVEVTAPDDSGS